jgi:hypothetical protein
MTSEDAEENPSLRQRFGAKFAEKLKKQNRERKQADLFKQATRKFRPKKSELGSIVLLAATKARGVNVGDRVGPNHKGKVFALYVTKTRKVKPYREKVFTDAGRRKTKTKVPVPYRPRTLDPQQFPTQAARRKALKLLVVRGDKLIRPVRIEAKRGNVRWHETVVPLAVDAMQRMVHRATGGRGAGNLQTMVEIAIEVTMPDGQVRTITVTDDFGQRRAQQADADFYRPFFERKTYALMAEQLSMMGLVTTGSSQRIGKLPENRGLPRGEWTRKGQPWQKRYFEDVRVSAVTITPMLVRVSNK